MEQKKRPTLVPNYMQNFKCIGSTCEDSCCCHWRIDIDEKSYKNYQKIRDKELRPLFHKYLILNRSNFNKNTYAVINLLEDGKCPFLEKDMLCKIQNKHGYEYLSTVCCSFPRVTNMVNNVVERSADLSCPEAARIALLDPKEMEFDENEESSDIRNMITSIIDTHDPNLKDVLLKYLWDLRIFTITVLQYRNITISERLVFLGLFFQNVQKHIDLKMVAEIPKIISSYNDLLQNNSLENTFASIQSNNFIQMKLLKEIADEIHSFAIKVKRYAECAEEFLYGLQIKDESDIEIISGRYNDAYIKYYQPFMKEHSYILENYLVNYVFRNLFPFADGLTLFDSYMMLVVHFSLIKMHLIGISAFHKGLTIEHIIKLIQSFEKNIVHSPLYLKHIAALMKKNGFNSMAYMSILIMN